MGGNDGGRRGLAGALLLKLLEQDVLFSGLLQTLLELALLGLVQLALDELLLTETREKTDFLFVAGAKDVRVLMAVLCVFKAEVEGKTRPLYSKSYLVPHKGMRA